VQPLGLKSLVSFAFASPFPADPLDIVRCT
jgi:hypothetical protein